jgi:hypothetical protein
MARNRELTTKDGVPLDELLDIATGIVDIYNEADRPFRDLFVEEVNQQTFTQDPTGGEMTWEELAEGEAPRTGDVQESKQMTFRIAKYGRSLGMTQEFVEDNTEEQVLKRFRKMVAGAQEREEQVVFDAIKSGIADGSQLWYDVPDYGEYSHSNTHDHWFEDSSVLFGDSNNYEAHEHLESAKDHMTHHGFDGPFVALMGTDFKRNLRDEFTYNMQYHIPMANGLRSGDVRDLDIVVDNIRAVETPWIKGNEFYITQVQNDSPVKFYERRPVQITAPDGGRAVHPGDLLGASGSARYGVKMVNPLKAAYVSATNLA